MAVRRAKDDEETLALCAIGDWTVEDERKHRERVRTAPGFGMFRDPRDKKRRK